MGIYVKYLLFPYFLLFFLVFKHDFIRFVDYARTAASNTASYDVTNYVTQRIFIIDLSYSCAHFLLEIDET